MIPVEIIELRDPDRVLIVVDHSIPLVADYEGDGVFTPHYWAYRRVTTGSDEFDPIVPKESTIANESACEAFNEVYQAVIDEVDNYYTDEDGIVEADWNLVLCDEPVIRITEPYTFVVDGYITVTWNPDTLEGQAIDERDKDGNRS